MRAELVEAAGTRLFVRRFGADGPGVVYWHGGGGASDEVPRIAPALAAAGYAVYAPDAPGYGESPPVETERYRASAIAEIAAALIDELAVAPAIWIGFSWGGSIGFHVAARYPDRVRALVLLDGGYLMSDDDPSYDTSLDFEGRIEAWLVELERQEEEDDAPPEIVAAAMAGSNVEPALPLLTDLAATGIPVLLVAAMKPPEWNEIPHPSDRGAPRGAPGHHRRASRGRSRRPAGRRRRGAPDRPRLAGSPGLIRPEAQLAH